MPSFDNNKNGLISMNNTNIITIGVEFVFETVNFVRYYIVSGITVLWHFVRIEYALDYTRIYETTFQNVLNPIFVHYLKINLLLEHFVIIIEFKYVQGYVGYIILFCCKIVFTQLTLMNYRCIMNSRLRSPQPHGNHGYQIALYQNSEQCLINYDDRGPHRQ